MRTTILSSVVGMLFVVGCGAVDSNRDGGGGGTSGSGAAGSTNPPEPIGPIGQGGGGPGPNPDAFWENDPPPQYCGPDEVSPPEPPGGTPECPDDKNREGCPCDNIGEEAPCWPGLRKNRNLGICKDGTTVCQPYGEIQAVWGECKGYTLPKPGATEGKEACQCFSAGQWKLENVAPCFILDANGDVAGALSTCPQTVTFPLTLPSEPWSANTVTADCAGHFKLCFTLKAGSATAPNPSDCTITQVCTEADYLEADQVQPFPDLPAWFTNTPESAACAAEFYEGGGYAEMTVVGQSISCDEIPERVFLRNDYCPLICATNPGLPECANCSNNGSGEF